MSRPVIKLIFGNDETGPMVHYPNGHVEWLDGFRKYFGFIWWIVRHGHRVVVVDVESGKETEI